ncbi:MAG: Na+/H+ antiporter subunit G [Deltaproteobacteria bacterium CG11_big_fil_rev_8_21_14_0_20_45_16]|nr:MAG: Na+/H+ antiporter subunit G [Deltaproteobacteria bacterium CG11_big_fil_rev_8_21_14_0_20_45_16]
MIGEFLMLLGAFFMFSGALGLNRAEDSFQRFHIAGKVSLFGLAIFILGDIIIYHEETSSWSFIAVLGILILLFTGPFAAHVLAQALYRQKNSKKS